MFLTKVVMFIVHCICSTLSCRLSAQFCPQFPHGSFACCCLNMSFIHNLLVKSKTLPAVCADLVNPWISSKATCEVVQLFFVAVNVNASNWWHAYLHSLLYLWGCKRDVVHESQKVPAYHQICMEIDPTLIVPVHDRLKFFHQLYKII